MSIISYTRNQTISLDWLI